MKLNDIKKPLAITMWDSSWLRRRYVGGGFENFDTALDELIERGYNAVRIDAFPHMIANAPDGTNSERFLDPTGVNHQKYGFAQWGSPWTVYVYPRRDIVDFLKKCEERGVYVILSTWLKPTIEPRNEWIEGPMDLVRVWDETLEFLNKNNCLNNVIGVDVQNEFPYGACNMWLANQMNSFKKDVALGNTPNRKTEFYRNYFNTVIKELKIRWPALPFAASSEMLFFSEDRDMDYSNFDWLDVHVWVHRYKFEPVSEALNSIVEFGEPHRMYLNGGGNYMSTGFRIPGDINFEKYNEQIYDNWVKNIPAYEEWLEEKISFVASVGKKYGIPYGCTEGWGTICWAEHPLLTWDLIKEAGIMAAKLGSKYGYTFNCQSNFCAPHFLTLWRDVEYHREVSGIIKEGKL